MKKAGTIVPLGEIEQAILLIRGQRVMIDRDLARLYEVSTRDLNRAGARNIDRFPPDFMFQLHRDEAGNLMFHFGTSSWGGIRKLPRAFTEQGVAMLSSVLRKLKRSLGEWYPRSRGKVRRDRRGAGHSVTPKPIIARIFSARRITTAVRRRNSPAGRASVARRRFSAPPFTGSSLCSIR